jgi:hypothetical protein
MARGGGTRDGAVACSLTRLDERNSPRVVGPGIPAVERHLWPLLRPPWLARDALSMLVGTVVGAVSSICALLVSPETKGEVLVADLVLA